jgi:nitroimidazol reductase NimA-like FMN-containing flavoprotein (pyridoxamine 5'-phosphate oxidase superfamily)
MATETHTDTNQPKVTTVATRERDEVHAMMQELSREECFELLSRNHFGRLAVVINGAPVIRPVNFVFDRPSQSVIFRTGRGSKFQALLNASEASFEIDGINETARTGWSVIIQGVTAAVTFPTDIRRLAALGLQTWAPGRKPHWVHIRARTVSGRRIVIGSAPVPCDCSMG